MDPFGRASKRTFAQRVGDGIKTLNIFVLAVLGIVFVLLPWVAYERVAGLFRPSCPEPSGH